MGIYATYIIAHTIFWDGRLSRSDEVPFPIKFIAELVAGRTFEEENEAIFQKKYGTEFGEEPNRKPAEDRLIAESVQELSGNAIFNFFADPNPSFRNLIMNTGFVS